MSASSNASIIPQPSAARLPISAISSLALHALGFGLLLYTSHLASRHKVTTVNDVDFIQVKRTMPKAVVEAVPKASTFDFLKMALPAVPKAAQSMSIKLPEAHKTMTVQTPKLDMDKKKFDAGPKLDMDLDKGKSLDIAKVEARIPAKKMAALAAMPKLEEVGRRRVANLPAAIAMEERRQEAQAMQGMDVLSKQTVRRGGFANVEAIRDAAPAQTNFGSKIAAMLPSDAIEMKHAVMPASSGIKQAIEAPVAKRKVAVQQTEGKKGVEIEGPLADRKVVAYEVPEFPKWAKDQGVLEANVSIRFWVNSAGDVLSNMRVEHTSGYGRLDRTAMDSLANWKFAPLPAEAKQWGVITFRFVLE